MPENPLKTPEIPVRSSTAERRRRYAAAMDAVTGGICPTDLIDAVMAVADAEIRAIDEAADETARRLLSQRQEMAEERYAWQERGDRAEAENARLHEELRKAKRAANLLASDHRAVERVQRRLDAWEQRLPENVRTATVLEVLRSDLDGAA